MSLYLVSHLLVVLVVVITVAFGVFLMYTGIIPLQLSFGASLNEWSRAIFSASAPELLY